MKDFNWNPVTLTHDLGTFPTSTSLIAQYPTGRPGDSARVTATETTWFWNGSAWADSTIKYESSSADFREFNEIDSDPLTPDAGKSRVYLKNNALQIKTSDG
jgi:hypothetical protein